MIYPPEGDKRCALVAQPMCSPPRLDAPFMNWPPPAKGLVAMPVELLALEMLRFIGHLNRPHYHRDTFVGMNQLTMSRGIEYRRPEVLSCVNEAWDWLFINGLTAEILDRTPGWRFLTRKGKALAAAVDPSKVLQGERLLSVPLHPAIEATARLQFSIGEYEAAVFIAFKALEIRVREACGFDDRIIGDALMRQAFSQNGGPLLDRSLHAGEQRSIMELYAGAIGAFKNPASHRAVDYGEPEIAAEAVLLADLLHRMLDRFIELSTTTPL